MVIVIVLDQIIVVIRCAYVEVILLLCSTLLSAVWILFFSIVLFLYDLIFLFTVCVFEFFVTLFVIFLCGSLQCFLFRVYPEKVFLLVALNGRISKKI